MGLVPPSGVSWPRPSLNTISTNFNNNRAPRFNNPGGLQSQTQLRLFIRVCRSIQHPDASTGFETWAGFQPTLLLRPSSPMKRTNCGLQNLSERSRLWLFDIRYGLVPFSPRKITVCNISVDPPDRPGPYQVEVGPSTPSSRSGMTVK